MATFDLSEDDFNEIIRLSQFYRREAQKCETSKAYFAGCIMIGATFEAVLLSFASCYPEEAMNSKYAPKRKGEVLPLLEWSLANLLLVARDQNWLPSSISTDENSDDANAQIGDYSEYVRLIRNLIHPARYAIDMPRKRITKKYLENVFNTIDVAVDHLLSKIYGSLQDTTKEE